MTILHAGSLLLLVLQLGCVLRCGRAASFESRTRECGSIRCLPKIFQQSQPSATTAGSKTLSSPERSLGMNATRKGWHKDRELQPLTTKQRHNPSFKLNTSLEEVAGDGPGGGDQEFVPIVDDKYANAARLVNEYVSRDQPFEDTHRSCPQTNWMRVQGTSGRCFKSFDFMEFRHRPPDIDDGSTVKQVGTWEEAERICMSFGAHLAALYTTAEMKFAHMVLDRRPDACWIGLRRLEQHRTRRHSDPSNGWKWVSGAPPHNSTARYRRSEHPIFPSPYVTGKVSVVWGGIYTTLNCPEKHILNNCFLVIPPVVICFSSAQITSEFGILDDTDPIEWHRDWALVWDSISYGKPLCGVFTRKGVAARRCYSFPGPTSALVDNRGKKGHRASSEKLPAPELSCFLCATSVGMKLPQNSFAYAAEKGLFEWEDTPDGGFVVAANSSDTAREDRYNDSGEARAKDERRHTKEGKKSTWGLSKQHERNSVKGLKSQAETASSNASRQTEENDTNHALGQKEPLVDRPDSQAKHQGRPENMSQRMRGFQETGATGYSTTAGIGAEYGDAEKAQSDLETGNTAKILALPIDTENNDIADGALPSDPDLRAGGRAPDETESDIAQSVATSPSSIRDNESYGAFLREFMRLHTQAKETIDRRRESVAATETPPDDDGATEDPAVVPNSSTSVTETERVGGDGDPEGGLTSAQKAPADVETEAKDSEMPVTIITAERTQATPSSRESPLGLHTDREVAVLSQTESATENVALMPTTPTSTPNPKGHTKAVAAKSNVKILHCVSWCTGTAIFIVGAALILIYLRCWVVPKESAASEEGSATTAPTALSSHSPVALSACPDESPVTGPLPSRTGSCRLPSGGSSVPTAKNLTCQRPPYADVCSPASDASAPCSQTRVVSPASLSRMASCEDSVGEAEAYETETDMTASDSSQSMVSERVGSDTFVLAIVRGIRVAAGVSQVSSSRNASVRGPTSAVSSEWPRLSSDTSHTSHRPSPAERLERLRARIDAL
ncbi:conserved hypothetical protein [Neospora caninum Liverpool]|uniref:C-type lectin domain-containing protein n=1 Tax=Neospora caninum (strain Liverpool) TaxID=572307 RepID=F0VPV9_NEOCL|nr:conserved hypothetical protein [Neospora caninum Liverpool]CBZ55756.1 conserved hypothetical protein [Neospora caninum Liverpool]CEL70499.1 TPA: hypothetical protein BN1204_061810 [Neospora caninum Liverpool]|eukprot:XP_003885782.1 conserved hypothetical protein [Neospora caninum Liverpool]